jgi:hypothetical protein
MSCPKCGSDDWKMASVIHAEGLSGISTSTVGLGVGTGGLGAGVASTKGNQQTKLSKLAVPPRLDSHDGTLSIVIGFFFVFVPPFFIEDNNFVIFLLICGFFLIVIGISENSKKEVAEEKYKKELAAYKNKKMCLRCGTFFFDDCEIVMPSPIITESINSSDMKKCPFCAEEVKADAIRCKHCRSDI